MDVRSEQLCLVRDVGQDRSGAGRVIQDYGLPDLYDGEVGVPMYGTYGRVDNLTSYGR